METATLWVPYLSEGTTAFKHFQENNELPEKALGSKVFLLHKGMSVETMCALYTVPLVKVDEKPRKILYVEVIPVAEKEDGFYEYALTEVYAILQVEADTSFKVVQRGTALLVKEEVYHASCNEAYMKAMWQLEQEF